jgi:hypothetical protein
MGGMEDSQDIFQIFIQTLMDYSQRMNVMGMTGGNDPDVIASLRQKRRPIVSNMPFGKFENDLCFSPGSSCTDVLVSVTILSPG